MKRFVVLAALLLSELSVRDIAAEELITLGASARGRYEVRRDFRFDDTLPANNDDYFLTQVRLNARFRPDKNLEGFIEGQHVGILDEEYIDDDSAPNLFADDFDLHQAYVRAGLEDAPVALKLGRQKLKYGSERIIGPLEWSNTARVFDGALLSIGDSTIRSVDLFASRMVAVHPHSFNDWGTTGNRYADSELYGVYGSDRKLVEKGAVEGYYLLRHENEKGDAVHTVGSRVDAPVGRWRLDAEGAFQWGDFSDLDHRAYALHGGVSYLVYEPSVVKLGSAYNFGSGDDDPSDGDHGTFDNLFPTNHAFYGYMDLFSLQNMHNLEFTITSSPLSDLELRGAWQLFWLAEEDSDAWYNAGLGTLRGAAAEDVDSYAGSEFDLTASYTLLEKKLNILVGYSHFFCGSYVSDTGKSEDADFFYTQVKFVTNP